MTRSICYGDNNYYWLGQPERRLHLETFRSLKKLFIDGTLKKKVKFSLVIKKKNYGRTCSPRLMCEVDCENCAGHDEASGCGRRLAAIKL